MIIGFTSLPHYCWHTRGEWCQIWICSLCFAMVFGGKMNVGRDEWWWTQTKTYLRPQGKVLKCLMKLGRYLEFDAFYVQNMEWSMTQLGFYMDFIDFVPLGQAILSIKARYDMGGFPFTSKWISIPSFCVHKLRYYDMMRFCVLNSWISWDWVGIETQNICKKIV